MALFSRKPKAEKAAPKAKESKEVKAAVQPVATGNVSGKLAHVLQHARITEKASDVATRGVYVFNISQKATKRDIAFAVKELYNVTPRKVAVVTIRSKVRRNMRTGRSGIKTGGRKAYVYLKSGDTITVA